MDSGTGSDPFAEDSDSSSEREGPSGSELELDDAATPRSRSATPDGVSEDAPLSEGRLPYIFDRDTVKAGRNELHYFLHDETMEMVNHLQRDIEAELGTEVFLTDVREALVRIGAQQGDEVIEELREWGYKFEEE